MEVICKGGFSDGMRYVQNDFPKRISRGRALVHNHVLHSANTPNGTNGFRAWTEPLPLREKLTACDCGWAGLPHYRIKGLGANRKANEVGGR